MKRRSGLAGRGLRATVPLRLAAYALLLILAALPAAFSPPVASAGDPVQNGEEKRLVIGLFDGQGEEDQPDTDQPIWSMLEMPLNHLGMVVRSHDVRQGPPPDDWLPKARAVLTWLRPGLEPPDWLWPWIEKQVPAHGLRVIHFQYMGGVAATEAGRKLLARYLGRLGLEWRDGFVDNRMRVGVQLRSEALCALEDDPRRYAHHQGPRSTGADNVIWVSTRDRNHPTDVRTPVVTGPWGGFAMSPWTIRPGAAPGSRRWHMDPFVFFRDALGLASVPAPHPSVLNGRRMLVFHVDGDGFESLSRIRAGALAARVFLDEVLDVYKIPATVSIIVASLTRDLRGEGIADRMEVAADIMNRPYVEAASHGVLHPYRWDAPWAPGRPPLSTLPYKSLAHYDYSPVAEVRESLRFITDRLLRDGKRCRVMLWTGDCLPPREAILECARLDSTNFNGGTFRWDDAYDSLGYVSPWVRQVDDAVQVMAGAANENEFPGFFSTHPGAFAHVDATIERTGRGRVLKPANVYAHYYSAESAPRLAALKRILDRWVRKEPTAPVFASAYAEAVQGALTARIERTSTGWALRNFGACRTVRIDADPRHVDFGQSRGVLGARRIDGSLYVHLTGSEADLVLAPAPAAHPHLEEANHALSHGKLSKQGIAVTSQAGFERTLVFAGLPPSANMDVRVGKVQEQRKTDAKGRLEITLAAGGPQVIEVRAP